MDERKLIVLSGPSGCGKDTVLRKIRELDPSVAANISFTTREPRPGEVDGVNYHFITKEQFLENIENGVMLEYNEYSGNYYGTSKKAIEELLEAGKTLVLTIDVNGGKNVKKTYPGAMLLFLMPPSISELKKRIRKRGHMDAKDLKERMRIAEEEIRYAEHYDVIIETDDGEICARDCLEAIRAWGEDAPEACNIDRDITKSEEI